MVTLGLLSFSSFWRGMLLWSRTHCAQSGDFVSVKLQNMFYCRSLEENVKTYLYLLHKFTTKN